jgi:phosphonoacetaldehyde hydrolase
MKCAAVIFDWAGTVVDFGSCAPVVAMRSAFEAERVAATDPEIRAHMGLAKRDHVAAMLKAPRLAEAWQSAHGARAGEAEIDRIFARLDHLMRDAGAQRAELIPGVAAVARRLRAHGIRIGSTTGYTRAMMVPIIEAAAAQEYSPETIICAGETARGRPSPFMIWTALMAMDTWPAQAVVKVDDAPAGIAEGKNAGCLTIGVAASGNAVGLDLAGYYALSPEERALRVTAARTELLAAGADLVIDTVADLPDALQARGWL